MKKLVYRINLRRWSSSRKAYVCRLYYYFSTSLGLWVLASVCLANGAPDAGRIIAQGASQLQAGQGAEAYRSLLPHVAWLAGRSDFDRIFGQAALVADQPSQAAFAFERCLALNPLDGLCRLGMLRAHIMLAEAQAARNEIDIISQNAPPPEVQVILADYMRLLTGKEPTNQDTRLTAYIQGGIGYDSNVNNAMSQDSLALPAFGGMVFSVSRDGRSRESAFYQTQLNASYSTPINAHWRFVAEGTATANQYGSAHDYDTLIADASLGITRREDHHQITLKIQGQHYNLGGHGYRDLVGLLGQYAYSVTDRSEVNGFAHVTRMTYPGMSLNNANRYTGGVSWSQALSNGRGVFYASAYGGREASVRGDAQETLSFSFTGVRFGGMVLLSPRTQIEAGIGAERRRYGGKEVLFLERRRETQYDSYLSLNHSLNRRVSIRPQYRYIRSDSSIPLRDYPRHTFSVNLRYELF